MKFNEKRLKMRVQKKHPKNHSKNRFWGAILASKTHPNRRKILPKTILEKDAKKLFGIARKKTCLDK